MSFIYVNKTVKGLKNHTAEVQYFLTSHTTRSLWVNLGGVKINDYQAAQDSRGCNHDPCLPAFHGLGQNVSM